MPAPSELVYFVSRLYARTLTAVPGPYRDALIAAGSALESAMELHTPDQTLPAHNARMEQEAARLATLAEARAARSRAAQDAQNAEWDATMGMSTAERRAFEKLPQVTRAPQFTVNVARKWVGKRDKLDGTRDCTFSARYSSTYGVVGGGPACRSQLQAATEALQFLSPNTETRAAIRDATSVKALCDILAPLNWLVIFNGSMNGISTYVVRRVTQSHT